MRNKMTDLRNHLFEQIEKIKEAQPEDLTNENEKGKAMTELAKVIVDSAKAEVDFIKVTGIEVGDSFVDNIANVKRLES